MTFKLHHVAIWVSDLDEAAAFWQREFGAEIGAPYESKRQVGFVSRFARLGDDGINIELMTKPGLPPAIIEHLGWAHIAISLGSKTAVDEASERFAKQGRLALGPRTTGDGYYEAIVLGPDDLQIVLII